MSLLHAALRRRRFVVQFHVRAPVSKPLCLSSYRASFVNSYSSVQVRPEAPSGLWCNSSISPCEGDGPGANPGFLTNSTINQQIVMRSDMHKVVVERPRWNPGPGKHGRRANLSDELLPKFEGIKRPHARRKGLTDLLGPLKRWLRSQVGRPWNDVYSEACAVIKPDSVIRAHIKTHLLEFVHRHTFLKDNEVWCFAGRWRHGEVPVGSVVSNWTPFYIHPETGLLCELPAR